MAEDTKSRWVIHGIGSWIMVVLVWLLALGAGWQLGTNDSWLAKLGGVLFSAILWLAALMKRRGQD